MPALIEIAYDNSETIFEFILPGTEYWLAYFDPENQESRVMRISCSTDDGYSKAEIGNTSERIDALTLIEPPTGITDRGEEIWAICDGTNNGLLAVSHTALLVSDFSAEIY